MGSSFWLDEMVTVFVVEHPHDPSLAVAPQVPDSIYYALPRWSARLFGSSEIAYRLPSLLLMFIALAFITRLAARLIFPEAAWFAAFACMGLSGFNVQAADARPYAMGTCLVAAGFWFLMDWFDHTRWDDAVLFILCGALLWRVSLIYWPVYMAFGIYAVVRLSRRDTGAGWVRTIAMFVVIGALLTPVLLDALRVNENARAHVIVAMPRGRDLIDALKLGLVVGACAAAALLARWFRWEFPPSQVSAGALTLMLAWWLSQPIALFLFSHITGNSVFVGRYLSVALPAVGIVAAAAAALYVPQPHWRNLSLALGIGVLLVMGQWNRLWPRHNNSDWRGAVQSINALRLAPDTPIICPSPFIEAKPPVWRPDYPLPSFIYADLAVYHLNGKPYLFPFEDSPAADAYAAQLTASVLPKFDRFVIYGGDRNVWLWRNWFAARPEFGGWQTKRLGPFGDVDVIELVRDGQ